MLLKKQNDWKQIIMVKNIGFGSQFHSQSHQVCDFGKSPDPLPLLVSSKEAWSLYLMELPWGPREAGL